jgi:hypothetical protein
MKNIFKGLGRCALIAAVSAIAPARVHAMLRTVIIPSHEPARFPQPFAVGPETSLDVLDTLVFATTYSCDEAVPAMDALEAEIVEVKARYWAYLMKQPDFAVQNLSRHPGSEIANPTIRAFFDSRLRFWYQQREAAALPPETIEKINDISQKIDMMAVACGKRNS